MRGIKVGVPTTYGPEGLGVDDAGVSAKATWSYSSPPTLSMIQAAGTSRSDSGTIEADLNWSDEIAGDNIAISETPQRVEENGRYWWVFKVDVSFAHKVTVSTTNILEYLGISSVGIGPAGFDAVPGRETISGSLGVDELSIPVATPACDIPGSCLCGSTD